MTTAQRKTKYTDICRVFDYKNRQTIHSLRIHVNMGVETKLPIKSTICRIIVFSAEMIKRAPNSIATK